MDSLLAAIIAAPDDDGPRLVWADREGGERGELVVLQCQIAARAGSRADRVRMQTRVRDLVPEFQDEGETIRRGFVESIEIELAQLGPGLLERYPVATEIEIEDFMPYVTSGDDQRIASAWQETATLLANAFATLPHGRIRALEMRGEIHERGDDGELSSEDHAFGDELVALVARWPALVGLRELTIIGGGLTEAVIPHVARLGIEALYGGARMNGGSAARLLTEAPNVRRFGPWNGEPNITGASLDALLAAPATRELRALDLWANELTEHDLRAIAKTPFTQLESLCIGMSPLTKRGLEALAKSPHLAAITELNMYVLEGTPSPAPFLRPPFALERLRLGRIDDAIRDALIAAPALEVLQVDTIESWDLARLRKAIPRVNDGRF